MSKPNLVVIESLAQDQYQAYETIELQSVVGTPIERAPKVIVDEMIDQEAQIAAAWAAVHARLTGNSGGHHLPAYDAVPAQAAPEWSQVHASISSRITVPRHVLAEGSRAAAPKPQALIVETPLPQPGPSRYVSPVAPAAQAVPQAVPEAVTLRQARGTVAPEPAAAPAPVSPRLLAQPQPRMASRRSLVGFTAEDEAFFAEGERLAEVEDFSDLDEPAPRRSQPMSVPSLRYSS
jgi:hypothetical protein